MQSLELGHGYSWRILVKSPALIAHGSPSHGNMPELLLIADRTLVLDGGDPAYAARIKSVLAMLSRQSEWSAQNGGGRTLG
ncbi:MAG: hypothetical protein ACFFAY_15715 [Promethearchaeota archaeon]